MAILITGGAGYIGSHTCIELLENNEEIIIVDNFSNSNAETLDKIREISGKDFKFYEVDILNENELSKVFEENEIESVIHFAALKAVGESVEKPLEYYTNNLTGTLTLLNVMKKYNCKSIVFSSSATVYGNPHTVPIKEDFPLSTTNPYGATKLMVEDILKDLYKSDNSYHIVILRYFNPIGAHQSGLIGENPKGIPNNLLPYIARVASGQLECLSVYGDDYDTIDGTGVRDYIHVLDLACGHQKAIEKSRQKSGLYIYNLGTGNGYSVLEMVQAFENVNNVKVNYKVIERREGDIATCFADSTKALNELDWEAKYNLEDMCRDSWNFIIKNK